MDSGEKDGEAGSEENESQCGFCIMNDKYFNLNVLFS